MEVEEGGEQRAPTILQEGNSLCDEAVLLPYAPLRWDGYAVTYRDKVHQKTYWWQNQWQAWVDSSWYYTSDEEFDTIQLAEMSHIRDETGFPGMLITLKAAGAKAHGSSDPSAKEKRLARDSRPYSCKEFIGFYGDTWMWYWDEALIATSTGEEDSDDISTADSEQCIAPEAVCANCGELTSCVDGSAQWSKATYCNGCWTHWRSLVTSVPRLLPDGSSTHEPHRCVTGGVHFDFIEVGTSDWGTISQYCSGHSLDASLMGEEIRTSLESLRDVRGLAVEAVGEHLASLPTLPRVTQVEAALGEFSGEAVLYHVSAENISNNMGKFHTNMTLDHEVDVMWYAKSMASVGKPHPELEMMLRKVGREDLLEEKPIKVLSWSDLCVRYGVGSVDVVQLDCEGMDCSILRGLITHCQWHPQAFPRVIAFEANSLTDQEEVDATLEALVANGYNVRTHSWENIVVERYR